MDLKDARKKFNSQKASAARRGIEFEFTFEEWCAIWNAHWEQRGHHKDQKVMCRKNDSGPYKVGNVRIDSPHGNAQDRRKWSAGERGKGIRTGFFKSYGSLWPKPDQAMEWAEEEYEWIPGE